MEIQINLESYTRRFFLGRHPLCGIGVTSSIVLTFKPADCKAVIALSRPEPGPQLRELQTWPLFQQLVEQHIVQQMEYSFDFP
jgi:hypothetical protein